MEKQAQEVIFTVIQTFKMLIFFAFLLIHLPLSLYLPPCSKSDMSRLRLAAGGAIMKLAQEPCYHDIITPEQFQLCGLVINVSLFISFDRTLKWRTFSHEPDTHKE